MTLSAFQLLQGVISQCWRFFNGWTVPGTFTTPAELFIFVATAYVTLRFFKRVARVSDSSADSKSK